jgi:hypothetical protein
LYQQDQRQSYCPKHFRGSIYFEGGIGAHNKVKRRGDSGNIVFAGAGISNQVISEVKDGNISFHELKAICYKILFMTASSDWAEMCCLNLALTLSK